VYFFYKIFFVFVEGVVGLGVGVRRRNGSPGKAWDFGGDFLLGESWAEYKETERGRRMGG
jgi:hypothetical protein